MKKRTGLEYTNRFPEKSFTSVLLHAKKKMGVAAPIVERALWASVVHDYCA